MYSPDYESGGRTFMYYLSKATFTMMHISNVTFYGMFALKKAGVQGVLYVVITTIGTIVLQKNINNRFITPSIRLAYTNSRMFDEQNKVSLICPRRIHCSHMMYYRFIGTRRTLEEKRIRFT